LIDRLAWDTPEDCATKKQERKRGELSEQFKLPARANLTARRSDFQLLGSIDRLKSLSAVKETSQRLVRRRANLSNADEIKIQTYEHN
jgi:hypothetical protein